MTPTLALDPGYGNIKLYGAKGTLVMQSAVSVGGAHAVRPMAGLKAAKPPLRIETLAGRFYVGEGAHDWGRPIETLDFDRLTGSPELMALLYGTLTRYEVPDEPLNLIVGLPLHALVDVDAAATQVAVRAALRGTHTWSADGLPHTVTVDTVRITSQPVGAMFDYLLDDAGQLPLGRRLAVKDEMGILGIGMNTLDLLVVRNATPVQRFTAGETLGVRRLLELMHGDGGYSLAEMDLRLREAPTAVPEACRLWGSEVLGFIERTWGREFRRFRVIVAVGGGTALLREPLLRRFQDKLFIPDDPIISTARGLYKYSLKGQGGG